MYWATLGSKRKFDSIDRDNPSWSDIADLLEASRILTDSVRGQQAMYNWISGLIRRNGPQWVMSIGTT